MAQAKVIRTVTRDEFFAMAGISGEGEYEPVSIGKGFKLRETNNNWINSLRRLNFVDAEGLRGIRPEHVTESSVVIPIEKADAEGNRYVDTTPQDRYKAIVGDDTKRVYSIRSDRYHAVQHSQIVEALVDASLSTGVRVFGTLNDKGGNLNVHAFFADPDCNIDLSGRNEDPAMLGVRCFNSHNGTTRFGAELMGVRWLCSNMCAFGDVLGRMSWNHRVESENIVDALSGLIVRSMDRVPVLQARIAEMQETELTLDEVECALWGISLNPYKVEAVRTHLRDLNPEIGESVTVYDLWNAVNAYTSYAVSGGSVQSKSTELNGTQDLITRDIGKLVDRGAGRRNDYLRTIDMRNAEVSVVG